MENALLSLFEKCLSKKYTTTPIGGSWAYDRTGDALYLWFEKSNGVRDWLHNLNFAAVPYRDMNPVWQCHAGFLRVWKSIQPLVEPLILDPSVRRICTVGYSHGAAVAVLCHEYIVYHRPALSGSVIGIGYGCPRVLLGCATPPLARRWESFFIVRNQGDLVTHLPPTSLGFCHVGNLVEIGEKDRYSPINAHRPESYLSELRLL